MKKQIFFKYDTPLTIDNQVAEFGVTEEEIQKDINGVEFIISRKSQPIMGVDKNGLLKILKDSKKATEAKTKKQTDLFDAQIAQVTAL